MDKKRITLLHLKGGNYSCKFKPYESIVWNELEWVEQISFPPVSDKDMEVLMNEHSTKEQVHRILNSLTR